MADVFISYSSKDRESAQTLATALRAVGRSVWWDREILTGQAFDHAIEKELDAARSVVVLWSRESIGSEWVKNEAASASERGILLPANIDGTRLPLEFRRRHTADLSGWTGDPSHDGFRAVCRGVDSIVGGDTVSPTRTSAEAAKGRGRHLTLLAVAVVVILVASVYAVLPDNTDSSKQAVQPRQQASSELSTATQAPAKVLVELADAVVGDYWGEVISDSRGSSRTHIGVTVRKLGPNRVRATSSYDRIGTVDVELTQIDKQILSTGGDTPFMVDLGAAPPTLLLNPHNELAYRGTLRQ
ncbi:toll/interleukin-1 receptor domain-containing protein [Candidatus Accumulibacter phosphatis]|uniref:Toll/interleukin-1 receptor domain-containing protein n=1 Tax=Candidatus Accumulibacter phosphatis TaxID=327160 RepID=A0ABX1TZY0_9PROT|nr:toll/interleukin-1 receptor domain-containing protein [Candidatus Accumulibacter phosphatis]NMQ28203.1 toll/interleukin-1 receptor domain-containing protein [Candidatus Accumulibacter phosphatis]